MLAKQLRPFPREPTSGIDRTSTGDGDMALALITVWAIRTGRSLRPVPVHELSAEELEDFWADEQMLVQRP